MVLTRAILKKGEDQAPGSSASTPQNKGQACIHHYFPAATETTQSLLVAPVATTEDVPPVTIISLDTSEVLSVSLPAAQGEPRTAATNERTFGEDNIDLSANLSADILEALAMNSPTAAGLPHNTSPICCPSQTSMNQLRANLEQEPLVADNLSSSDDQQSSPPPPAPYYAVPVEILECISSTLGRMTKLISEQKKTIDVINSQLRDFQTITNKNFGIIRGTLNERGKQLEEVLKKEEEIKKNQTNDHALIAQNAKEIQKIGKVLNSVESKVINLIAEYRTTEKDKAQGLPRPIESTSKDRGLALVEQTDGAKQLKPKPTGNKMPTPSRPNIPPFFNPRVPQKLENQPSSRTIIDCHSLSFLPLFPEEDGYILRSFNIKAFLGLCHLRLALRNICPKDIAKITYTNWDKRTTTTNILFSDPDIVDLIWSHREFFLGKGIDILSTVKGNLASSSSAGEVNPVLPHCSVLSDRGSSRSRWVPPSGPVVKEPVDPTDYKALYLDNSAKLNSLMEAMQDLGLVVSMDSPPQNILEDEASS